MTHRHDISQLGDSWVVRESDASDASLEEDAAVRSTTGRKSNLRSVDRRRISRASSQIPEPDLVMPSIHVDSLDGSWITATGRQKKSPTVQRRTARARTPLEHSNANLALPEARTAIRKPNGSMKSSNQSSSTEQLLAALSNVMSWITDVLGGTLKSLKRPISYVLAIYVFSGLVILVQNLLTSSIYTALSPLCRVPGTSMLNLPMCQSRSSNSRDDGGRAPVEFDQLMEVQSQFEDMLEQSSAGVSLPHDMKRGEASIRDLRQVVRYSSLRSKNELLLELDGFIETARMASYDLQSFNSHVGRGVDIVLSTARWTQRVLDEMAHKESSDVGAASFIRDKLLAPFQPVRFAESKLLDQYIQHTRIVSEEIQRLLAEAQALLLLLKNLEDRLDVIHGISTRDNLAAETDKDEILTHLWTAIGGNRAKLGKYNKQLDLLRQVGNHRKIAWAHVSGTILKLQAMGAELEQLQERVSSAEVLRDTMQVPLAVHLESIRLGVERLERGREASREIETGHIRNVLDKGREIERLMVEG